MKFVTTKHFSLALVLVLVSLGAASAQNSKSRRSLDTLATAAARASSFENGEELSYIGEFSRLLLKKMDVADFRFTARRQEPDKTGSDAGAQTSTAATTTLKLTGDITSRGFFSRLFNLTFRERIESHVEPASFTVLKTKRTDEQGKRVRISETVYDRGKLFWIERDPNNPTRTPRSANVSFNGQMHDLLSAIYYLRTQPLEVGKTFEVMISDSGRVYQVPVRVVEKKRMKTVLGRVEALRVDPQLYGPGGMVGGKGQFSIWFTNDNRRIPVSARIKTEYGTFDITLRKWSPGTNKK